MQIDLIFTPDEDYESTLNYMGGNDLGNFIGRLAQTIGFKYGQEGLWINYHSDANTKNKIMVSKNYLDIFKFLGLDYNKFVEGFDTLEDIFKYVMTSSLFNPEIFQLTYLNKINRDRNIKRASYMSFLEFIKNKGTHPDYNKTTVALAKKNVIDIIREAFPEANIDLHLAQINYNLAKKKLIYAKFNGNIIKEKYGLEGEELGKSIKGFKNYIHQIYFEEEFDEVILKYELSYIYKMFELSLNKGVI